MTLDVYHDSIVITFVANEITLRIGTGAHTSVSLSEGLDEPLPILGNVCLTVAEQVLKD